MINLANPDKEKEEKAYNGFLDDLKRCEQLGIGLFNFHPGSSLGSDHTEAIERLAFNINKAIGETSAVKIVIENMAGHGHLLGSKLEDLRDVIALIDDKDRVGVCLDTCHSFAAGYDIRTEDGFDAFIAQFDKIVGAEYLSAIHLNDSKADLGANRDLHERLGWGFLGLEVFRVIANHPRLQDMPIILETPTGDDPTIWADEIKLLEWFNDKKADDPEVLERVEKENKKVSEERPVGKKGAKRSSTSSTKGKKVRKKV
jgi:AP endonuclease-1